MSTPGPEQPVRPADTLGALKRSGFALHQLNSGQENFSYKVGRGKDRKELSISRQEIRDLVFAKTETEVVALGVATEAKKTLTREGLKEQAQKIKTRISDIRALIGKTNDELIEKVSGSPEKAQELKTKYRAQTEKKLEQKIAASERGALAARMRTRYKEMLSSLPADKQNAATGTPKERLMQLLTEGALPPGEADRIRSALARPIDGFMGNRYVEVFNTRIQDEWGGKQEQTTDAGVSGTLEGERASEIRSILPAAQEQNPIGINGTTSSGRPIEESDVPSGPTATLSFAGRSIDD